MLPTEERAVRSQLPSTPPETPHRPGSRWIGLGGFGLYLLPALVAFWHCLPHLATVQPALGGGDLAKYDWCVAWVPFALGHGLNPLLTHYANVPHGVNLMDDTSVPGLGLVMSPVTVLFGPFASVNLLLILAYPLSAGAAYLLARRYVQWRPAAFAAGLLYGYSPYMVAQGYGHLNLSFVPIPPLVFLLLDELVIRQRRAPARTGLLLGLLLAAQFFISTEILATTVMFAVISVAALAIWRRDEVRDQAPHAARALAAAVLTTTVLLAWPAYEAVWGPHHIHGAIAGFRTYFDALAGPVLPTSLLVFGTHHLKALGDAIGVNASENGSYLGLPLVLLSGATVVLVKRSRVKIAAALALVAFVLSLGSRLHLGVGAGDGVARHVVLPATVIGWIPLLQDSFPIRYSLYVALFVSLVLAFALEALHERAPTRGRSWLAPAVALAVLLPLLPAWPGAAQGRVVIPSYFTTSAVRSLATGEVTLVYPMAVPADTFAMDWQAAAGFRFAMPGGYFVQPKQPSGSEFVDPTATEQALSAVAQSRPPARTAVLRARLRSELRSWGVTSVVAQPVGADPEGFLKWLIGRPQDSDAGGMIEWYHLSWAASR